jgi:RNA polymerase-binding transcription factor DksA
VEERYESELAQSTRVLDDVDRALERLTSGSYDTCEACGAVIPDVQLAADPTRRTCDQHGSGRAPLSVADPAEETAEHE